MSKQQDTDLCLTLAHPSGTHVAGTIAKALSGFDPVTNPDLATGVWDDACSILGGGDKQVFEAVGRVHLLHSSGLNGVQATSVWDDIQSWLQGRQVCVFVF